MILPKELLQKLGFGEILIGLAEGNFKFLSNHFVSEYSGYGYPPALIPILNSDNPSYLGYWKHHFSARPANFVELSLEIAVAYEEARNARDFILNIVFKYVEMRNIDTNMRSFIQYAFPNEEERIVKTVKEYGDSTSGLKNFAEDERDLPLESLETDGSYGGFHPISSRDIYSKYRIIENELICGFEYDQDLRNLELELEMPWLNIDSHKYDLYKFYYSKAQFAEAWMTLNSSGWEAGDAIYALEAMTKISNSRTLEDIYIAWRTNHEHLIGSQAF
jgi:hypothetical protein